ncbi:hypothetical protein KI387_027668, partial [Taxus chinensis]
EGYKGLIPAMAAPVSSSSSAMDSSYEAQELRYLLLSSNTQADILNSCRAMETFIQTHNTNQCRHFYVYAKITVMKLKLSPMSFQNLEAASYHEFTRVVERPLMSQGKQRN